MERGAKPLRYAKFYRGNMQLIKQLLKEAAFSNTKTYFHGGRISKKAKAIFFTSDFKIAETFSEYDDKPIVYEARLKINNPAKPAQLKQIIKKVGISEDEMIDLLNHDIEDNHDYLEHPKIIAALKAAGFDGVVGQGAFDTMMIDEYIIFDQSQMDVVKIHKVG
jgi:hypothetical protein